MKCDRCGSKMSFISEWESTDNGKKVCRSLVYPNVKIFSQKSEYKLIKKLYMYIQNKLF